ncbi:MAG: sodium:solute symporter family protein, partial [Planctomycetota bacterium]
WIIVGAYCVIAILIGIWLSKRASKGTDDFFISGRALPWWLAGTSMVATTFASDTPLFVTGLVRSKGIWGNWLWWALGISTVFSVFVFSRLWRRARVVTEVELTELRYAGKPAAALRGFKALYIGLLFNCYAVGAWPMTGLTKVMEVTTGWSKGLALGVCVSIAVVYSVLAGFWGVVATDFIQFIIAVIGAIILAAYALDRIGGLDVLVEKLAPTGKLEFFPPGAEAGGDLLTSPLGWVLGLVLIQWWAWKNSDGGGIIIQRMSSCRNEKEAVYATLWYNIAHYAIRSWPWIIVALASLVLLSDMDIDGDPEKAYPKMIMLCLPAGLKGLLIASFFAAFMSTADTHMNWGASYVTNDFYRRFVRKRASEKHYVLMSRLFSVAIIGGAVLVAFFTDSIVEAFTFILMVTAGIGVVNLARWFWWRVNAWSEIAVMLASIPAVCWKDAVLWKLGWVRNPLLLELLYMVVATALVWVPVTLLTRPVGEQKLIEFYRRARPPGPGWARIRKLVPDARPTTSLGEDIFLWLVGVVSIFGMTMGLGFLLVGSRLLGVWELVLSLGLLWFIIDRVRKSGAVGEKT